jgi:predicted PurR-regulated permease PerM
MASSSRQPFADLASFALKLLVALAVVALGFILFRWLHLLLLAFGAALIAVLLRALADPIRRRTPLNDGWSVGAALAGVALLVALITWFVGGQISRQMTQLGQALPAAWAAAQHQLMLYDAGRWLLDRVQRGAALEGVSLGPLAGRIGHVAGLGVEALVETLIVIVAGVYFAVQPRLYRDNLLKLAPLSVRPALAETFDDANIALKRWLLGTGAAMLIMGVLTAIGASLLGLPVPLALGILSGLAEFVPIAGAAVSALPGLLLAATLGPDMILWTLLFYVGAHQVESQIVIPLIQRKVVSAPPALTLFSILGFSLLFGPVGVVFATPLLVVLLVTVRRLYLHEPPVDAQGSAPVSDAGPSPSGVRLAGDKG